MPCLRTLGRVYRSLDEMMDECPAQKPSELTHLHCWDEEANFAKFGASELELDLEPVDDDAMAPLQEAAVRLAVSEVEAQRWEAILMEQKKSRSDIADLQKKLSLKKSQKAKTRRMKKALRTVRK